jgi:quercetin dioxygenase-like cupin family protein
MNYKITMVGNPKDPRGENYTIEHDRTLEITTQRTEAGKARGGHSHKNEEDFFVVSGKALFLSRTREEKFNEPRIYRRGETIETVPMEPHMILAVEETVLIGIRPIGYEDIPDPLFKKIVNALSEQS